MSRLRRLDLGRIAILLILVIGTAAIFTKDQWDWLLGDGDAQTTGAEAPTIDDVDSATERLYRIVPDGGSTVTYRIEERLAGRSGIAEGTTTVLAGDIKVNLEDPSSSEVGEIVVNVEMFESGSNLRDRRIRHDFLESTHYPFATFVPTAVEGIPTVVDDGTSSDLTITGDLTIKETTESVTFTGTATLAADELRASMSADLLLSTYDVGPIHVAGLAHTGDDVELSFELVAGRVELGDATPGRGQLEVQPVVATPGGGSFAAEVMPILERGCVYCHSSGGPGWSTVALDTAADAAAIADDIALVTGAGYMPPWPASDLSVAFQHDYSLPDEDIAAIAKWAADGGGLDVAPDTPLNAVAAPFDDIERDTVAPPASGAYVGSLDLKDDYRCQIHEVPDPEGDGTWITGIAFEPDKDAVVHHSIIYRVAAAQRANADERDGADGQPGWTCFGRSGLGSNALADPEGVYSIGGWAPGQQPRVYPDGVGLYLAPGDFIVNQIHYHFDHETPPDASVLVFDTLTSEDVAAREAAGEPMISPQGTTFLTPAEGPCTPEDEGPLCDRDAVLDDIASKYGIEARFIPDALIGGCEGTLEDFAVLDGTTFHSSCDKRFPASGTLYSVLGHMHEFGAAYRMTLHPDTPEERILLDIPTWSFEWQLYYEPAEEIRIERGDVFRLECTWDRSLVTLDEPRYITWNEGTVDEMCFSTAQVIPDR